MIDIVTVVFREELDILKLQAKSIQQYCDIDYLGKIIVVVNDDTLDINDIDCNWWGKLKDRVAIAHRSTWQVDYTDNGWLTQQLLKIMATELCVSKWSMILDAKTLFVNPIPKFDDKPQVGCLDIYPVFEISQQRVNNLFDIELTKQLGPGGVPFLFNNQLVYDMIVETQHRVGQSFATWFQDQGMITEFILYSGYVVYRTGSLDSIYNIDQSLIEPCNLCHSEVDAFNYKFNLMKKATTVSIHRNAWKQLTPEQQHKYTEFLQSRGIS